MNSALWGDTSSIRFDRASRNEHVWSFEPSSSSSSLVRVSDFLMPFFVELCPWPFEIVDRCLLEQTHLIRVDPFKERTDWGCQ